ncbi:hypothetical protein [Actinoplanes sp. NPDC048796]|uniref:hypothetical protein n=1 Tax=Actinoplanes sp. NPDC048796 TaxID=3155640 RepID=UPI0033E31A31
MGLRLDGDLARTVVAVTLPYIGAGLGLALLALAAVGPLLEIRYRARHRKADHR